MAWKRFLQERVAGGECLSPVDGSLSGGGAVQWLRAMWSRWSLWPSASMRQALSVAPPLVAFPPHAGHALTGFAWGGTGVIGAGAVLAVYSEGGHGAEGSRLPFHREGWFELRTLDEARHLAASLAPQFPDPVTAALGLAELMVNAVEHGNLRISTSEKSDLLRQGVWEEEVQRRLLLPENAAKRVRVELRREGSELVLLIRDDGPGFDWEQYCNLDPVRADEPNGRGIALVRQLAFPNLEYLSAGNIARVVVPMKPMTDPRGGSTP
jgi:anti-sigma regulatory factor (Ser/Thr protein kinase)